MACKYENMVKELEDLLNLPNVKDRDDVKELKDLLGVKEEPIAEAEQIEVPTERIKGSDISKAPGQEDTDIEKETIELDIQSEFGIDDMFHDLFAEEGRELKSQEFYDMSTNLFETYRDIAREVNFDKVNIRKFSNAILETGGAFDTKTGEILMREGAGRLASNSEIFIHELGHGIAGSVFENDVDIRNTMKDLRDAVADSGIDYRLFLEGVEDPTGLEVEHAKRKFDYVFDKSADPEEFYAYVTSNEAVFEATKDIRIKTDLVAKVKGMKPRKDGKENTFQEVMNKFIEVINKTWRALTGREGTGEQVLANLIVKIAKRVAEIEDERAKDTEESLGGDQSFWGATKNHAIRIDENLQEVISKKDGIIEKVKGTVGKPLTKVGKQMKDISTIHAAMETGALSYLYNTVTKDTTNKEVTELYQVFRKSKSFIEKHTSEIRDSITRRIRDEYIGEDENNPKVSESVQKAVKAIVIDADLEALGTTDIEELTKVLSDDKYLKDEIKKTEKLFVDSMSSRKEYENLFFSAKDRLEQMDGLAHYMVFGETIKHNQQMNVNNILLGYDVVLEGFSKKDYQGFRERLNEDITETKEIADKLVTLKAIEKSYKEDKELAVKMLETEPEIFIETMTMYKNYMKDMRGEANVGLYDIVRKGESRAEEGLVKYRLVPESEVDGQLSVNMKLVNDDFEYTFIGKNKTKIDERLNAVKPYVKIGKTNYYLMKGRSTDVSFSEGAIGLISNTAEGVTLSSLLKKNDELAEKNVLDQDVEKARRNIIRDFAIDGKSKDFKLVSGTTMVPVYDHTGSLIDYRLQMTKAQKSKELDEGDSLPEVLSNTFTRSTKTALTKEYNEVVIDAILRNSSETIDEEPDDIVMVEEYTDVMAERGVKYEKRHERWDNLPDYTKDYIFENTKIKGIPIHKDFVELMTGEKDLTIGNFKIGKVDIKKNPVAKARLEAIERYIKEILGHVKRATILYDSGIIIGNVMSNMTVAAIHGIDPITYVKEMTNNWKLLNEYNELSRKKADIEVLGKTGKNVENKLRAIQKLIDNHEFHELVKDGQFTPIAEDINVDAKPDGQLYGMVQDWIDGKDKYQIEEGDSEAEIKRKQKARETHDSIASVVNGVKNVLYIDKASKLGKLMLKNTQYQDAMTRRTIQKRLFEKKAKERGVNVNKLSQEDKQEILDYLDQLLVNYGYTMNRYWAYAEKVAGVMFLRYYMGQAKALASMSSKNPLGVILTEGGQGMTGIDLADPFETYLRSFLESISNRWMLDNSIDKLIDPNIGDLLKI